ncbi:MAG: Hpt domain-containing protein, partial [Rhodocyclaceae bacterium]|nr:Hpt domain-containing protein [Rhodocyclaceae bacterium]
MAATDVVGLSDHLTFDLEPPAPEPSDLGIDLDWSPTKTRIPETPARAAPDPNATLIVDINEFTLDIEPPPAPAAAPAPQDADMSATMVVDINSYGVDLDLAPPLEMPAAGSGALPAEPVLDVAATQVMDFNALAANETPAPGAEVTALDIDFDFGAPPVDDAVQITLDEASELSLDLEAELPAAAADLAAPELAAAPEPPAALPAAPAADLPDGEVQLGDMRISQSLFDLYCNECRAHLTTLREELGTLQCQPDAVPSEPLVRAAHTLAGISRTVGVQPIAEVARALEHAAGGFHTHQLVPRQDEIQLFAAAVEALERQAALVVQVREPQIEAELVTALNDLTAGIARAAITGELGARRKQAGPGDMDAVAPVMDLESGADEALPGLEAPMALAASALPPEILAIDLELGEKPASFDLEAAAPPAGELAPGEVPAIDLEFGEEPMLLDLEAQVPVAAEIAPAEAAAMDLEFG